MRVIGIDPGIARTGWGVVDSINGKVTVVDFGCIETDKQNSQQFRLAAVYQTVSDLFKAFAPDSLAIEDLFFNTNAKTALIVGQARGVVLLSAAQKQLPVHVYTPLQVKMAITGYGRAEKNQIGQMVKTLLHLSQIPKPDDTADALAIALTHSFSSKMLK